MKRRKKLTRLLCILFSMILVLSVLPMGVMAETDPDDMTEEEQKERLKELETEIQTYRDNANEQARLADALQEEIKILDKQVTKVEKEIVDLSAKINETQLKLDRAQQNLDKASADKIAYQKQLEERMVAMYMYGGNGYLEVLFGSESFSDFISRATAISSIIAYDNEIARKLRETENLIDAQRALIADQKAALDAMMEDLKAKEAELESQMETKNAAVAEVAALRDYWIAQADELNDEAFELRKILAENNSDGDFANNYTTFLWPTPGYYWITDYFGWRICPFHGYEWHTGLDIGAPRNAKAIAPCNGKVIRASWYGGYGNCIILDLGRDERGNTYKCLYAHLNSYAVDVGDVVMQGDTVGYVGTTGNSTGYHLHFEIILNGVEQDPLEWLTK